MKRLQLRHHDEIFDSRSLALEFFKNITDSSHVDSISFGTSLYAEPMVLKYGQESNPSIILAIGSIGTGVADMANKTFFIDLAYVDANHTYQATMGYVHFLLDRMSEMGMIVIDDIHYSPAMEQAWREICADERVTSSMDLYQMGMLFFDPHFWKRHYVLN